MVKKKWNEVFLNRIEEFIDLLKVENDGKLDSSNKKFLEKIIREHNKYSKEEVAKAIIIYAAFQGDEAILFFRERGIFRYKSFGTSANNAEYYINQLLNRKDFLQLSDISKEFLNQKKKCSWLLDYYQKTEFKLRKMIKEHHNLRERIFQDNIRWESSLFLELLSYLEIMFRDENERKPPVEDIRDRNIYESYSKEEKSEAVSYLLYLYTDEIGLDEKKNYWLDTHYVFSKEIKEMILMACKMNLLIEWEVFIDHYGYNIMQMNDVWKINDETVDLEKSIRLGYVKQIMQEVKANRKQPWMDDACTLEQMGEDIVEKLGESLYEFIDDRKLKRYQIRLQPKLIELFMPKKDGDSPLYVEEIKILDYMAREFLLSSEKMKMKKITEHCTMIDLLYFKRLFTLIVFIQKYIFRKEKNKNYIASSVVSVFSEERLLEAVNCFTRDQQKSRELLDLLTWDTNNKLDLQYTPILKIGKKYYFSAATLAIANSYRNSIANSYYLNKQKTNSDGTDDPLIDILETSFMRCDYHYTTKKNLSFTYQKQQGEVDFVAYTDQDIFIFECKAPLIPTNNFEMRSTFDYVKKANKQLDLCVKAFKDDSFRKKYFKNWGMSEEIENIYTCILMGNRLFSGGKSNHSIRYIYELDMVLNGGWISSAAGEWSYWDTEQYQNQELIKFLSDRDLLTKSLFEAMEEYCETLVCGSQKIVFDSYYFNSYKAMTLFDKCFRVTKENKEFRNQLEKELVQIGEKWDDEL